MIIEYDRPADEIHAMEALGFIPDVDGDYLDGRGLVFVYVLSPQDAGTRPLSGLRHPSKWVVLRGMVPPPGFDTPIAAALWWQLEQANN